MNRIAAIVAALLVTVAFGFTGVAAAGSSPAGDGSTASSEVGVASTSATGGLAVISPVVGAAQEDDGNETAGNETSDDSTDNETEANESVAPGARLAGVLGAQQEEVQGEVESRAFGHAIAAARSNGSRARLVANNTDRLQERLDRLENRLESLNESFENESIPRGVYYAKATRLSAQIRTTERMINQTADTARMVPPQARMEHGVNVTQLDQLRSQVRNLSGHQVSAIARQIAGPGVGQQMGPRRGPPNGTPGQGPPDGSHGPGQAGDRGQNGSGNMGPPGTNESDSAGNMGPPGTNQTDSNRTDQGPPNGTSNASNGSGQGNSGQDPSDDGDDDAESVDRPGLPVSLGSANGLLAAIVRSIPGNSG